MTREQRAFGHHLLHDAGAADADGAERGDLAETLVHGDGEQRGHEQHRHEEAHGAQDVGQLAEVEQRIRNAATRSPTLFTARTGNSCRSARVIAVGVDARSRLYHEERHAVAGVAARDGLQRAECQADRSAGRGSRRASAPCRVRRAGARVPALLAICGSSRPDRRMVSPIVAPSAAAAGAAEQEAVGIARRDVAARFELDRSPAPRARRRRRRA